jgi:hypothetical protein
MLRVWIWLGFALCVGIFWSGYEVGFNQREDFPVLFAHFPPPGEPFYYQVVQSSPFRAVRAGMIGFSGPINESECKQVMQAAKSAGVTDAETSFCISNYTHSVRGKGGVN